MQQQARAVTTGQQIAQILLQHSSPATVLPLIALAVRKVFEVDCSVVALFEERKLLLSEGMPEGMRCYASTQIGGTEKIVEDASILGMSLVSWLSQLSSSGSEILTISNTTTAPNGEVNETANGTSEAEAVGELSQLPYRAVLGMATQLDGQVNGGLVLMKGQPYHWTELEMEQLKVVSNQVAIAIDRVGKNQTLARAARFQDSSSQKYQTLLYDLTTTIHRSPNPEQSRQQAIERLVDAFEVERGSILLLKYRDPLFRLKTKTILRGKENGQQAIPPAKVTVVSEASSFTDPGEIGKSFSLSDCAWCQETFTSAPNPVAIADQRSVISINPYFRVGPIFEADAMPAFVNVPLVGAAARSAGRATILGFLVLQHSTPRHWSPDELKLLEVVAAQLSTAILHSQTLQQVQGLVQERSSQLQRSLEVQAKLYEKTRQQVDQLRHLNELKDDFLSTLSHELNTPLTTMKMAIKMLREDSLPAERKAKYMDILEAELKRESNMVQDLLELQKIEFQKADVELELIDLKKFINSLSGTFEDKWVDKELKLSVHLPRTTLKVQTDTKSLEHVVLELLTNAGKYSYPGTTVSLRAAAKPDTNEVVITLKNMGAGISKEDLPHIFDKFHRGSGMTQKAIAGTGLGLALVKSFVQQLGGTITVTSSPSRKVKSPDLDSAPWETCFTITLPQELVSDGQ